MIPGQAQQFFEAAAAQAGASGYEIERSLRFNSADSAYLNKTPSSAGNRKTWTWSGWVKRCQFSTLDGLFFQDTGSNDTDYGGIFFNTDGTLAFNGWSTVFRRTSAVYRDPGAWMHIVVACDTTLSDADSRMRFYVNGTEITDWHTKNTITQNADLSINKTSEHRIGRVTSSYANQYLTEVQFVDGQALAATDFGEYDADTGVWNPKEYTNTFQLASGTPSTSNGGIVIKADDSSINGTFVVNGGVKTWTSPDGITWTRDGSGRTSAAAKYLAVGGAGTATKSFYPDTGSGNYTYFVYNGTEFDGSTSPLTLDLTSQTYIAPADSSHGLNGFYLNFSDNSSDAALGTDSSGLNNTWTPNNFVASASAAVPAIDLDGNDSIEYPGPGDGISGDFTMECFFLMDSGASGFQRIFSTNEGSYSDEQTIIRRTSGGNIQFYAGNSSPADHTGGSITADVWHHAAIVRSSGTISYYYDGSRLSTDSYSTSFDITKLVVGGGYGSENFLGDVHGARFTLGQALYSGSSYTVPTSAITTTSQGATASNVKVLAGTTSTVNENAGTLGDGTISGDPTAITASVFGNAYDQDSLIDTPTSYTADSGNNGGNYCTLNPLDRQSTNGTLSNGNLDITQSPSAWAMYRSTMFVSSGKWYWELTIGNNQYTTIGICTDVYQMASATNNWVSGSSEMFGYYPYNGNKYNGGAGVSYTTADTTASGSVIGVALDMDNGTLAFYKDGTSLGTAYTGLTGKNVSPTHWLYDASNVDSYNFGQRPFAYTNAGTDRPAATFLSLCTQNLSNPTIADGSTVMDALLYNGTNDIGYSVTGLSFAPDFVWIKCRSTGTTDHVLGNKIDEGSHLASNTTDTEGTGLIQSLDSGGFSLASNSGRTNQSGRTYVGWCWDGGTSTSSNTDGSITSSVRANPSAGISIVSWTGRDGTVGHGLNDKPGLILTKIRNSSSIWPVQHSALGTNILQLESTAAAAADSSNRFNATEATSSVFTAGTWWNSSSQGIAYCFAPVEGYSSFGSYEGNGSTDGPFVYTGFRPKWILIKRTNGLGPWLIVDTKRNTFNVMDNHLLANDAAAENGSTIGNICDSVSNGFKLRGSDGWFNGSSADYVYAAFAEHPFKTARAR